MSVAMLSLAIMACADAGLAPAARVEVPPVVLAAADTTPEVVTETANSVPEEVISAPDEAFESLVFADESDEAVVDRVVGYLEALDTLTGDFTQVAPSGAISTGKFFLRRPGLLRFEYDPPSPLLIVATGGTVFVRDDALETTDSYPVGKTPLKFLLRKRVELGDAKVVAVDRGVDSAAITFASDDEDDAGELSVIVSAPEMQLTEWIVRDPQNGVTIVTLDNVTAGEKIPNRLFAAPETETPFLKN